MTGMAAEPEQRGSEQPNNGGNKQSGNRDNGRPNNRDKSQPEDRLSRQETNCQEPARWPQDLAGQPHERNPTRCYRHR